MERWQQDRALSRAHEQWLEPDDEEEDEEEDEYNPFDFDRKEDDY